jgi:nitrite reductase/ring-hydroxylating ferredoxin subunit
MKIQRILYFIRHFFLEKIIINSWLFQNSKKPIIKKVELENISSISQEDSLKYINNGGVVIIRDCLQFIESKKQIDQLIISSAIKCLGLKKAKDLEKKGFEKAHELLSFEDAKKLYSEIEKINPSYAVNIMTRIMFSVFQVKKSFYAETTPNTRIFFPHDIMSKPDVKTLKNTANAIGRGKVTLHSPHCDSWFHHPYNCINIWIAIGHVSSKNGLAIFPQSWGKNLSYTQDRNVNKAHYLGPALKFDLQPGDAVIFSSEHLHGSTINQTEDTRFAMSMRMTLDKPDYNADFNWFDYRKIQYDLNSSMNAKVQRTAGIKFMKARLGRRIPKLSVTSKDFINSEYPINLDTIYNKNNPSVIKFHPNNLQENSIHLASDKICVARIKNDITAFNRYCTHEGADLALGSIQNDHIVCPWHSLCFNKDTGMTKCKTIKPIKIHQCELKDDGYIEVNTALVKGNDVD